MATRRFELVAGKSAKFWEVWTKGATVWTRYGRIGSEGTESSREEASAKAAKAAQEELIREKTAKGYAEAHQLGAAAKGSTRSAKASGATRGTAKGPAAKVITIATKRATGSATRAPAAQAAVKPGKATASTKKKAARSEDVPPSEFDAQIARIEKRAARAGVELRPGASEKQIVEAERMLGRTLPAEVRAFYRRHDGTDEDQEVSPFQGSYLLSLSGILNQWQTLRKLLEKGAFAAADATVEPDAGVQQRWWIWEWVPVTHDSSGNYQAIDLAPARGGTYGQVISFWHDDVPRTVEGKGFLAWLERATWGDG